MAAVGWTPLEPRIGRICRGHLVSCPNVVRGNQIRVYRLFVVFIVYSCLRFVRVGFKLCIFLFLCCLVWFVSTLAKRLARQTTLVISFVRPIRRTKRDTS